jgi:hypothetical protein
VKTFALSGVVAEVAQEQQQIAEAVFDSTD